MVNESSQITSYVMLYELCFQLLATKSTFLTEWRTLLMYKSGQQNGTRLSLVRWPILLHRIRIDIKSRNWVDQFCTSILVIKVLNVVIKESLVKISVKRKNNHENDFCGISKITPLQKRLPRTTLALTPCSPVWSALFKNRLVFYLL